MKYLISLIFLASLVSCSSTKNAGPSKAYRQAEIYYNKGTNDILEKKYSSALKNLMKANSLKPGTSKIENNLGMAFFFKNKPNIAIRYIKKSLKTDPKNTNARQNLATIYVNQQNYLEAKVQYQLILDDLTYEDQYKTYYNLGLLSLRLQKKDEAISYFKQSINENKNYCPANFQLGNIAFDKQNFEKSLSYYKKASLGTCYNSPKPIFKQALSLIELKDYHKAQEKLSEIVERFALTKYERMAHKKLKTIKKEIEKESLEVRFLDNIERKKSEN